MNCFNTSLRIVGAVLFAALGVKKVELSLTLFRSVNLLVLMIIPANFQPVKLEISLQQESQTGRQAWTP